MIVKKYYRIPVVTFDDVAIDLDDIYSCLSEEMNGFQDVDNEKILDYLYRHFPEILDAIGVAEIGTLDTYAIYSEVSDDFEEYLKIKNK